MSAKTTTGSNATAKKLAVEMADSYTIASGQLDAAAAILDAIAVLCALERAPEHHDTHPSHNITTGAGNAHGLRLRNDTLPTLAKHALDLVQIAGDDFDCVRESVIDFLKGGSE